MLDPLIARVDLTHRDEVKVLLDDFPVLWKELHRLIMENNIIPVQQQCSKIRIVKVRALAI